jgi:hypothetical protein
MKIDAVVQEMRSLRERVKQLEIGMQKIESLRLGLFGQAPSLVLMSIKEQRTLEALKTLTKPATAEDVARITGRHRATESMHLNHLFRRNMLSKGKPWTHKEEVKLKKLAQEGKSIDVIAGSLSKSEDAVYHKCKRLGLLVEEGAKGPRTSSLKIPKELPTVEETLKILAGALKTAIEPGLDKVEVQRLQVVATLARTYKDLLADYVDYRGIEMELIELRTKYEDLVRKVQNPPAH